MAYREPAFIMMSNIFAFSKRRIPARVAANGGAMFKYMIFKVNKH